MKSLKEFIAERLIYTDIYEMAVQFKEYKDKIISHSEIIIAHILLILNAENEIKNNINTDENKNLIKHWKHELYIFLDDFVNLKIKTKNTKEKKYKIIKQVLIDELELDTYGNLGLFCGNKLFKEGYDVVDDAATRKLFKNLTKFFQEKYLDSMILTMAGFDTKNFIDSL